MGRIRTIKPEFPQSESMGRVSREARLCFILLWTQADDSGRLRGSSRMLASLLYPYDDDAPKGVESWLRELEQEGCIRRYRVHDNQYIDIPKWLEHQKIDRPSASRLPSFEEGSRDFSEASRGLAPDLGPRTMDQGSGEDLVGADAPAPLPTAAEILSDDKPKRRRSRLGTDWQLDEQDRAFAQKRGFDDGWIGLNAEKFRDHYTREGTLSTDWHSNWRTWVNNGLEYRKRDERRRSGSDVQRAGGFTAAISSLIDHGETEGGD